MKLTEIKKVIISRTDAIGDVVLTLPMAAMIKELLSQDVKIIFFGNTYTYPVIRGCSAVDQFVNYDTFKIFDDKGKADFLREIDADAIIHVFPRKDIANAAKSAGIKTRIGTYSRLFHLNTCNQIIFLNRKNSVLHEAQLNLKLLKPIGLDSIFEKEKIPGYYRFDKIEPLTSSVAALLSNDKFRLIIHPLSNASGKEWMLENFRDLVRFLPQEKFQVIITGTENEKKIIESRIGTFPPGVLDLSGKLSLDELVSLINESDGLLAASTGPLHISAALGKYTLGLYSPVRPISPQRWAPLGMKAEYLVSGRSCDECSDPNGKCSCINDISINDVAGKIMEWI